MKTEDSAHYGEQLRWLSEQQPALMALAVAAGAQRGWWPPEQTEGNWQRCFARFTPLTAPYCTLLYERQGAAQHFCLLDVYAQPIAARRDHEIALPCAPLGWIKLNRFPYDALLTTLSRVVREEAQAKVVRYRPHLRCTLHSTTAEGMSVFVKVFPDHAGAGIHESGLLLWTAAARGELGFHVAQPLRWDADKLCLRQAVAPGAPAKPQLRGAGGAQLAHGLGRALGTLANTALPLREEFDAAWQLARTQPYLHELRARAPQAAAPLEAIATELERLHTRLDRAVLRPLHGAPHPQQWLAGEQGYALVDFDRCGLGEVEMDVATFMAEVDFENPRGYDTARINSAFLQGFESVAGALDPVRLGLYRAHKHVAKALRLTRSVRVDGVAKAAALLTHLHANLATMCDATRASAWTMASDWKRRASALAALLYTQWQSAAAEVCRFAECWL